MLDLFNVCNKHAPLNYSGQESRNNLPFMNDLPETYKSGRGHQTWYELVDPKHGYNRTKFGRPASNSIHQKADVKVFVKSENVSIISLEYVYK